ncbi:MAG: BatA domain-containing protein [Saprospiraceae bacterium]
MQFLYPTFLFALVALAIPIIIHLFYFRRFKKVYFTNVRFLKEVKEETSARSKLRNLLVLAMRLLALLLLVLAFAQPFIPQDVEVKTGQKAVSVFLDNSFSMSALSQDVALIDKAKQRAREIVQAYNVEDQFQVLTNDFEGRHQRMVSQEDALSLIDEITITPSVRKLSQVLERQKQALQTSTFENYVVYQVSDFQKNITDFETFTDTTFDVNLIPLQSVEERNINIDSAWFDSPVQMLNQTSPLMVKVRNLSPEDAENIRLSINYDGQTKPVGTLSIPANSSVIDTVNFTISRTGWYAAELAITDFPVQFDDKYYLSFKVAEQVNVLVINEDTPNRYLEAAFKGINYFNLTSLPSQNLDYSSFSNYQLIVLNGLNVITSGFAFELQEFMKKGGNLLAFPGRNANIASYKTFLQAIPANELLSWQEVPMQVGSINTEEFIFNDVFENKSANLNLPLSQGNFKMTDYGSRTAEVLMTYRDGTTFLEKFKSDKGHLYLCAAPLEETWNNLVRNGEIFIPMLYKMAISAGESRPIAYTIGQDELIESNHQGSTGDIVYKLQGGGEEFIPEQRIVGSTVFLSLNNQVREAGFYNLFLTKETTLDRFAFNFDRKESVLSYYTIDALQTMLGEKVSVIGTQNNEVLTAKIAERSQGIVLWRWCLILALLFLAAEVLFLRFWKV